jgi:predicted SAM-dependent methyltransferase
VTSTGLHLIVQLYGEHGSPARERILSCIRENSKLSFIQKITVICENQKQSFEETNIHTIISKRRATFADLLRVGASLGDSLVTHFAIANSDIFLSDDLARLMKRLSKPSSVAALTRTELNGQLFHQPSYSQDLWLFQVHSPIQEVLNSTNYHLGVAGCEHLFAMTLYTHGYDLWNPCLDCKIIHNDPVPKTQWSDRYYGSYLFLNPCLVEEAGSAEPSYEIHLCRKGFEQSDFVSKTALIEFARVSPIRLHLCCGDKKLPGYLGVDIRQEVAPDILASVDNLSLIEKESVEEIYFCHGLEHIPSNGAASCLLGLKRILKVGGILRLALPDFEALAKLYVADFCSLDEIKPAIYGAQDYSESFHYASWDIRSLSAILKRCGFDEIKRYLAPDFLPASYFDWSLHSIKGINTSLNIECIKSASPKK